MHKVSLLQRNRSPREEALDRPGQSWREPREERAPRSARVPAGGRPQRTLETCWGDPGSTVSSAFTDLAPPAPRLPLPLKESFYEEEVRELGLPGVSRAPKMRSIRKRWTICTISLLLIFYKTKEMARTEEHQETQLIG